MAVPHACVSDFLAAGAAGEDSRPRTTRALMGRLDFLECALSREGKVRDIRRGFVTSGTRLHSVKESILATNLSKTDKTLLSLVVLVINLLL